MRTRNCSLHLRLKEKELEDFKKKAERAGVNLQTYFVWMLYHHLIREAPPIEYQDVLRNLRQINHNMNQIATIANKLNYIDKTKYQENAEWLQRTVGKMMEEVYG